MPPAVGAPVLLDIGSLARLIPGMLQGADREGEVRWLTPARRLSMKGCRSTGSSDYCPGIRRTVLPGEVHIPKANASISSVHPDVNR
jgi:hypothetical protein